MKMRTLVSFAFCMLFMAVTATSVSAQTTTNFDNFTLGTPNGQFGWTKTGPYDHYVVDNSSYPNAPTSFGTQSLRISNAMTSGSFGDHTFSVSTSNEAGESTSTNGGMSGGVRQNYYEFSVSFTSATGTYQPGLSVVLSPDRGDGARMSWIQIADLADGLALNFNDYQGGAFVQTNIASGLSRTTSHILRVTMQFVEGSANDVVKVYLDGSLIHTGTSWEDYFRDWEDGFSRTVDSVLFRTGGASAPATANNGILFDDFSVNTGTIASNAGQCKKNGWMALLDSEGKPFKNQGQCVASTVGNN